MRLEFVNKTFVLRCSFEERHIPRQHGFLWHSEKRLWYTTNPGVAARLRGYGSSEAETVLRELLIHVSPWAVSLPQHFVSGLLPHQRIALNYTLERNTSYLGLDPGLGKTVIAAVASQAVYDAEPLTGIVYITPPFLVRNVVKEFSAWSTLRTKLLTSKTCADDFSQTDVIVLPDTFLTAVWLKYTLRDYLKHRMATYLIVDEAHRFKNDTANRTRALLGFKRSRPIFKMFDKRVFMSGTPMPNRPIELYPILSRVAPETINFMTKLEYGMRYCAAFQDEHGWDYSGASNVEELAANVKKAFMLRQKKDLLNLPSKLEQVFLLSDDMTPQLAKFDREISKSYRSAEDVVKEAIKNDLGRGDEPEDLPLATYQRLLGEQKAKAAIPYIRSLLDESDESIILYGRHKAVIAALVAALGAYRPFVITGATPEKERHEQVEQFQADLSRRLFIGSYEAMGVGFTLTKATRVVFVEFSWVPGVNDQAADRLHRYGQNKTVLIQYVVYEGSVDAAVINSLLKKRESIDLL